MKIDLTQTHDVIGAFKALIGQILKLNIMILQLYTLFLF